MRLREYHLGKARSVCGLDWAWSETPSIRLARLSRSSATESPVCPHQSDDRARHMVVNQVDVSLALDNLYVHEGAGKQHPS
jgi:hypothetical protein